MHKSDFTSILVPVKALSSPVLKYRTPGLGLGKPSCSEPGCECSSRLPRPAALYSHSITSDIAQSYHSASSLSPYGQAHIFGHVPEMHKHQLLHVQHFYPHTFKLFLQTLMTVSQNLVNDVVWSDFLSVHPTNTQSPRAGAFICLVSLSERISVNPPQMHFLLSFQTLSHSLISFSTLPGSFKNSEQREGGVALKRKNSSS